MNHLVLQGDDMIVQQRRTHGGVPHRLLQEGIGGLVIVQAHLDSRIQEEVPITGGEESITQWVHGEFIVISEAIRSHFTHQAHGEHF